MLSPGNVYEALRKRRWTHPVYAACRQWALAGVRSVRIDADTGDDVAGEVILSLFENPPVLDEPAALPSYVGTMARHLAVKRRTRQARERSDEQAVEARLAERVLAEPMDRDAEALVWATRKAVGIWIAARPDARLPLLSGLLRSEAEGGAECESREDWRELLSSLRAVAKLPAKAWRTEAAAERRQLNEVRRRLGALPLEELARILMHRREEIRWPEDRRLTLRWGGHRIPVDQIDRSEHGMGLRVRDSLSIPAGDPVLVELPDTELHATARWCGGGVLGLELRD